MRNQNPFKTGMMAIAQPRNKQIRLLMRGKIYPVLGAGEHLIAVRNEKGEKRWYKHTNFTTTLEKPISLLKALEALGGYADIREEGNLGEPPDFDMAHKLDTERMEAISVHHSDPGNKDIPHPLCSQVDMGIDELIAHRGIPTLPPNKKGPKRMKLWDRIKYMFGFGWI